MVLDLSNSSGRSRQRSRYSPESIDTLRNALTNLQARQPKAVSSTIHIYPPTAQTSADDDVIHTEGGKGTGPESHQKEEEENKQYITSWKMQEHLYRRKDCPFPTLARGLFIAREDFGLEGGPRTSLEGEAGETSGDAKEKVGHRIVARGYDKFFNVGEVEWTEVSL